MACVVFNKGKGLLTATHTVIKKESLLFPSVDGGGKDQRNIRAVYGAV
jgi:hypothetical protein